jgi:hypothetical protein
MSDRFDPSQNGAACQIVNSITIFSFGLRSLVVVGID